MNHAAALVEEIDHVIVGRKRYDLVHVIHGIENVGSDSILFLDGQRMMHDWRKKWKVL